MDSLLQALSHNLIFIAFYSILPIPIGLILASLLGRDRSAA